MTRNSIYIQGPITVTISGPQGSGKTTLATVLKDTIRSLGASDKVAVVETQSGVSSGKEPTA